MEHGAGLDQIIHHISLSMGAAWASGLNLYATICVLGIMGATGNLALPPELMVLATPGVIIAAGVMYVVEFVADKVPAFDTAWDSIHTFIRIPAGAILAAQAMGDVSNEAMVIAGILGGTLAAGTHAAKAGTRVLINTSPEPVSNWVASVSEDVMVVGGLYAALNYPWTFLGVLAGFVVLLIWLLPKLWRGIKAVARTIASLFTRRPAAHASPPTPPGELPAPPPGPSGPQGHAIPAASPHTDHHSNSQEIQETLETLKTLHAEGNISSQEYETMRAKLLERLVERPS